VEVMLKYLLSIVTVGTISFSAHAVFRSELFVGGSYGGQLSYRKSNVTYTMTNSGVPVGLFLGYKGNSGFYSGLEYTFIGMGFTDATAPSTHVDISTTHHYASVKLGYEGSRMRFYLAYAPSNTLYFYRKASTQTNTPDVLYGTSAIGAGIGFNMGARWAIDLSYFADTFSTFDFGSSKGQTINSSSTFNNITNSNIMLKLVFKLSGMK